MTQWTDWTRRSRPEAGDYVQVRCRHKVTGEVRVKEGEIDGMFYGVAWLKGELPKITSNWAAKEWRKRIDAPPIEAREMEMTHG